MNSQAININLSTMQNSTMTQNEGGDISTTKKAEDSKNDKPELDQII